MSKPPRVTAVVVTWNRKELLREALWALKMQTTLIDRIVVVDNASDDGTARLLDDEFGGLDIVTMARNTGGAGGFTIGLARALEGDADVVWLMDDDTVPEPGALAALLDVRATYAGGPLALIASKVVWTDGRDHPMNTPRIKPGVGDGELAAAQAVRCVPIRSASFVSMLVDAAMVRERGLPLADYFLWNDDFEFTTRLIRGRRALYCPASVVVHKTKTFGSTDADPGRALLLRGAQQVLDVRAIARAESRGEGDVRRLDLAPLGPHGRRSSATGRTLVKAAGRGRSGRRSAPGRARPSDGWPTSGRAASMSEPADAREQFSLLMSVWAGRPAGLPRSRLPFGRARPDASPDDVVLVQDGPVPAELEAMITSLIHESPAPTTLLALDSNVGLGIALDQGMAACAHDIVARMDADDIALPHRFAVQVPIVEGGVDIVGSSLLEFGTDPDDIVGKRVPPVDPDEIVSYARFHQPFNHPTVVYRRRAVEAAGGYRHLALMEDYLLFAKMIAQGCTVANVEEPLVLYRVGAGAYARRGGVALLKSEWRLQRQLQEMRFTSRRQFVRNIVVRGGYRLVPERLRRAAYRRLIATKGQRASQ